MRVINGDYQELAPTTLDRAIVLVEILRSAIVVEEDESRIIRTMGGREFFLPKLIRLIKVRLVPFYMADEHFSRDGVIKRDNSTCGYCGRLAYGENITWDHIIPKSKGGPDAWLNAIAACRKCNGKKADRTPEEAGMPMLWEPWTPQRKYFKSDKPRRKKKFKR